MAEPDRKGGGRGGRPTNRTVADVVAAAVTVLDDEGYATFSMRAVGNRLGMSAMGLYHHVESKDALLDLVVEHLLQPVAADVLQQGSALAALGAVAAGMQAVVRTHPQAVPLLAQPRLGPTVEAAGRHCAELLTSEGVAPEEAFEMVRAVVAQVVGEAVTSHGGPGTLGVDLVLDGVRHRLAGFTRATRDPGE